MSAAVHLRPIELRLGMIGMDVMDSNVLVLGVVIIN